MLAVLSARSAFRLTRPKSSRSIDLDLIGGRIIVSSKRFLLASMLAFTLPLCVIAQGHDHHATVQPESLKWSQPAAYAQGAELAVLKGDPTKEGMYVVRLRVPAGYRIPAHTHPNDE